MFSPKEKETQTFRSAPTLNGTGGNVRGLEKKLVFKCLYQIIALRFSQMRIRDNELYDNVEHLRDVIFVDRKLEGENGAIVVGDSGLRNNTGFTGINEATGTTIQDGKELTLIGGK